MQRGRQRLASARSEADANAVADDVRLGPMMRTLLAWAVMHDPSRVATFLLPSELVWAGLGGARMPDGFRRFGAPSEARLGCYCVDLLDPRPLDSFDGRWNAAMMAATFPELNLRLAELLAELRMPASLLGPVLAAATADFVDRAIARDRDDRRGLAEYVLALGRDRVEEYLATLTAADGPLVPVSGTGARALVVGAPR
jgi:hypothetical protein